MAKKGGSSRQSSNLLRVSGIVFSTMGVFHVLRYFEIVRSFDFTLFGSLLVGLLLLILAVACFAASR